MKSGDSNTRIRELLDWLEINQTEFCKRTGLNKSALSNYLNGSRSPRQDQIMKIADAFNVNPSWLLGYDVPMLTPVADLRDLELLPIEDQHNMKTVVMRRQLYKCLLEAARQCDCDQIKLAIDFLNAFVKANHKED